MNKKLQVFISSTFIDLQEERQAAVEAILKAGHIPAGMELFKAGNQSQWDTITRWIDESDIYMLILGGRYGSIEETSKKSYTHLEYDYAMSKNIPLFAVTLTDEAIQKKGEQLGFDKAIERHNTEKYNDFKSTVRSKMCTDVTDVKDIKLAVMDSLSELQRLNTFTGWVSGKDVPDVNGLNQDIIKLHQENVQLKEEVQKLKKINGDLVAKQQDKAEFNGLTFQELKSYLQSEKIKVPSEGNYKSSNLLSFLLILESTIAIGVYESESSDPLMKFVIYEVAPVYMRYGLVENVKSSRKLILSKSGQKFLAMLHKEKNEQIAITEE